MGNMNDRLEDPVTWKETEVGEGNDLRFGVSSMQGWRASMEDSHNVICSLPGLPYVSLFGVYDGHGGSLTSSYISKNLPTIFMNRKETRAYIKLSPTERDDVKGVKLMKDALVSSFIEIDEALLKCKAQQQKEIAEGRSENTKIERSGSTCVVVLVTPCHILCANAGDSRACFKRGGRTIPLSFDHKPINAPELSRIKNAGGNVSLRRIDGDLAVSRGLGDFQFKNRTDLPPEKQKVSCIPDVTIYPRNKKYDEFILLACDGIWDVVSNEECVEMVQDIFDEGENDLGKASEEILDLCLGKYSRDNMTIIIVTMPALKIGVGTGVDARRKGREAYEETSGTPFIQAQVLPAIQTRS